MFKIKFNLDKHIQFIGSTYVIRQPEEHLVKPFLFHPRFHLIQYFIEVDREVILKGKKLTIKPGSVMFTCANEPYTSIKPQTTTKAINIRFETLQHDEHIVDTQDSLYGDRCLFVPFLTNMSEHNTLRFMFEELLYLSMSSNKEMQLKGEFLLKQILIELSIREKSGHLNRSKGVMYTIDMINKNLDINYSIEELALLANMSRSSYLRAFKKHTNMTVKEFITHTKIRTAATLLSTEPGIKIKDIAEKLGYCDEFYFSNVFKKHTGKAPKLFI